MDGIGLGSSIWATTLRQTKGDWICTYCRFDNFSWRQECFKCKREKGFVANGADKRKDVGILEESKSAWSNGGIADGNHFLHSSDVWKDDFCLPDINGRATSFAPPNRSKGGGRIGFESPSLLGDSSCYSIGTCTPTDGLATSRWAPRSYDGRHNYTGPPQVWTRIAAPSEYSSQPQPSTRPPSPLDLGLPYEVQHYILGMMQRILEEGCYDFASRWVPSMLQSRNWTCSEAVELSAWKKFLPSAIPSSTLNLAHVSGSLESALTDAVKIRNSAVHRHLCDNRELRTMTSKAQDLMDMFGDRSRKDKFARLREELSVWDNSSDKDAARAQLEVALREIGERDMDDMDWTPNSVSLQEIKANVAVVTDATNRVGKFPVEHHGDEMEID